MRRSSAAWASTSPANPATRAEPHKIKSAVWAIHFSVSEINRGCMAFSFENFTSERSFSLADPLPSGKPHGFPENPAPSFIHVRASHDLYDDSGIVQYCGQYFCGPFEPGSPDSGVFGVSPAKPDPVGGGGPGRGPQRLHRPEPGRRPPRGSRPRRCPRAAVYGGAFHFVCAGGAVPLGALPAALHPGRNRIGPGDGVRPDCGALVLWQPVPYLRGEDVPGHREYGHSLCSCRASAR